MLLVWKASGKSKVLKTEKYSTSEFLLSINWYFDGCIYIHKNIVDGSYRFQTIVVPVDEITFSLNKDCGALCKAPYLEDCQTNVYMFRTLSQRDTRTSPHTSIIPYQSYCPHQSIKTHPRWHILKPYIQGWLQTLDQMISPTSDAWQFTTFWPVAQLRSSIKNGLHDDNNVLFK
jgi:hypothetical protein